MEEKENRMKTPNVSAGMSGGTAVVLCVSMKEGRNVVLLFQGVLKLCVYYTIDVHSVKDLATLGEGRLLPGSNSFDVGQIF